MRAIACVRAIGDDDDGSSSFCLCLVAPVFHVAFRDAVYSGRVSLLLLLATSGILATEIVMTFVVLHTTTNSLGRGRHRNRWVFAIQIVFFIIVTQRHTTTTLAMDQPKFFADRVFSFALLRNGNGIRKETGVVVQSTLSTLPTRAASVAVVASFRRSTFRSKKMHQKKFLTDAARMNVVVVVVVLAGLGHDKIGLVALLLARHFDLLLTVSSFRGVP